MNNKSVLIFLALLIGVLSVNASRATSTEVSVNGAKESQPQLMEMWGTCYFQFNCEGNPIGLGKTASECRAQGGHSLNVPNHGCYNI